MDAADIEITEIRFKPEEKPTFGRTVVMRFDAKVHGILLRNCALIHREDKGFEVWGPSRKFVQVPSKLRNAIKSVARPLYFEAQE
ncbi:hypothetical protein [Paracoccus sp. SCSIO 75233]|uniref:hypothetical protein n=1 Tax=Paracoccus sp. SCSIO 75233 TaxID=3017782 RepID=UPI0022F0C2CD|nr:hypothetical protein [Paracoccus sp. SCSIO 75233]WBU53332.1 hypothetical protein PAF12_00375 [Paracoccus sp. SCSIO 75233]